MELTLWTLDQVTLPIHGFPSPFNVPTKCDPKEDADDACMRLIQHTNILSSPHRDDATHHITFTGDPLVS